MPYKWWNYATKLAFIPMIGVVACAAVFWQQRDVLFAFAVLVFFPLCIIGAAMGVLMAMGKLRMRCPFCRKSGPAWGNKSAGMRMLCNTCGEISTFGFLGLRIRREHSDGRIK